MIDTPGVFDTDDSHEQTAIKVLDSLKLTNPGPHAILFTIPIERALEHIPRTFHRIKKYFGECVVRHMVVVFTRRDNIDSEGVELKDFIGSTTSAIQDILRECGKRYIAINNKTNNLNFKEIFRSYARF